MEERNQKTGLIVTLIIVIILLIGAVGYLAYDKYFKEDTKKEPITEQKENTDFYAIENLVKHKYIEKITTTEACSGDCENEYAKVYIKIKDGKVYVPEDINGYNLNFIEAKGIEGTPKYVDFMNYMSAESSRFAVLTEEGDLYYAEPEAYNENTDSMKVKDFVKINTEKVINMYDFAFGEGIQYPIKPVTIYAEMENGDLLKVNKGKITASYKDTWKYTDQICGGTTGPGHCLGLYITSDKKMYNVRNYNALENINDEEMIKYNNEPIIVKDAFSIVKEINTNEESETTSYYYIISTDNRLYKVTTNTDKKVIEIKLYSEVEVKDYSFSTTESTDKIIKTAKITYTDGKNEDFKDVNAFSTLYYRYNK